jgi:hypothetical protein
MSPAPARFIVATYQYCTKDELIMMMVYIHTYPTPDGMSIVNSAAVVKSAENNELY